MLLTSPIVVWSVILTPAIYVLYHVMMFILDVRRRGKAVEQFPGEPRHWLWGHLHLYPGPNARGLEFNRSIAVKYPYISHFWVGPLLPILNTYHPETSCHIIKSSEPKPTALGAYGFGRPWIGDGLLLSQGKKWARNRRLLTPAFHFDILKPYMKINNECASLLVDKIAKAADKKENFEFYSHVSLFTFDVILRCSMSYETDVQSKGENHPYISSITRLSDLWVDRVLTPWKHIGLFYKFSKDGKEFKKHCEYVHSISEDVIRKRQKILSEESESTSDKKRSMDFLDILIKARDEDGKGLTFIEMRDEVDTFMFEGHDTTASAISWTLYSLAEYPEYAKKCQEEIDEILKDRDSDEFTWDDLPKLKYVTQCLKEGMRLHCPVPFISRSLTKDMTIDGKTLPKNSIVDIQIYNLHHNPTIWDNNMVFDPSRFDPDKVEKMDSFAYVPFSAGPRNCIGQNFAMHEMKVIISRILRKFDLALDPTFKVEKKVGVVMRTVNGMEMKVTHRAK